MKVCRARHLPTPSVWGAGEMLAQLVKWHRVDGRDARYVCPAPRSGAHVTDAAVEKSYRVVLKVKDKHSPHSWRSVMKSWAADAGEPDDLAKACLDHGIGNKVDQAYDRSTRTDRRREFVARHEERLIAARDGAKVIRIAGSAR